MVTGALTWPGFRRSETLCYFSQASHASGGALPAPIREHVEHVVARLQDGRRMTTETAAAMLRAALAPTLLVGGVALVLAGLLVGSRGVWGALIALVLVVAFFGLSVLILGRSSRLDPAYAMVVALGLYVAKIVVVGATFITLDATGAVRGFADHLTLGLTTIACTLSWTGGEIYGAVRARQPIYDLGDRER
ncbi:MAG: hypothetical protein ACRDP9_10640 [Kribbellaceae bacterium]